MFPQSPNGVAAGAGLSSFDDAGRIGPDVQQAPSPDVSQQPLSSTAQPLPSTQAEPAAQPQAVKMVPESDLNNVRSIEQKRAAEFERRATQAEQRAVQAEQTAWITGRANQWYLACLAEGRDKDTAWKDAVIYAQEDLQQELQTSEIVSDATKYRQNQSSQDRLVALIEFQDEVVADTGLTKDELRAVTQHLNPNSRRFERDVWKAANAALQAKTQSAGVQARTPAQNAQALRQSMPIPGGGTNAGGLSQGRPVGLSRRDPRYAEWARQQLNQRESS